MRQYKYVTGLSITINQCDPRQKIAPKILTSCLIKRSSLVDQIGNLEEPLLVSSWTCHPRVFEIGIHALVTPSGATLRLTSIEKILDFWLFTYIYIYTQAQKKNRRKVNTHGLGRRTLQRFPVSKIVKLQQREGKRLLTSWIFIPCSFQF